MSKIAVAPGKWARGWDGVRESVSRAYRVMDLREALLAEYRTDAHLVAYVVPGATRQPRINKSGLDSYPDHVEVGVFLADVDNPDHSEWTDELLSTAAHQLQSLDCLQTVGVYHTAHGWRIVQPLDTAIPAGEVEPYIHQWLLELERAGIAVDHACKDWTRHYRLPHVVRNGRRYTSPVVDLERMRQISLPDLPEVDLDWEISQSSRAPRRAPVAVDWSTSVPPTWAERVPVIASAVQEVQTEWHTLFLALTGALLSRQVPAEHIPALIRSISQATSDTRTESREAGARTTVQRWTQDLPVTGYSQLVEHWPGVAAAVDEVTATGLDARIRAIVRDAPAIETRSLDEITADLVETIRRAAPGVTLIAADCGLGKTRAAIQVASERGARQHASPDATSDRAPPQSKTSISVDKHALAVQIQADPSLATVGTQRYYGPLSAHDSDGAPQCVYHEIGDALAKGGQSVQRELCTGRGLSQCDYYDECTARLGVDGAGRVTTGPHALISSLHAASGTTGLLVIDEPPALLEQMEISAADLLTLSLTERSFEPDYVAAMMPAVEAIRRWISSGDDETLDLQSGIALYGHHDAVESVMSAPLPDRRSTAPPLRQIEVMRLRWTQMVAEISTTSRVLHTIYRLVLSDWPVRCHVAGDRLCLVAPRDDLVDVLTREGTTAIVMGANVAADLPIYTHLLGYEPPLREYHAADGCEVSRCHLHCSEASRTHWIPHGHLAIKPSLVRAISEIMRWADGSDLAIITYRHLRVVLDMILRPDDPAVSRACEGSQEAVSRLSETCGTQLSGYPGRIVTGHYGAVRGLNNMMGCSQLATLGDPWPDVGTVQREIDYLGSSHHDDRMIALCRAELEQAHGRLRTIHRQTPCRCIHVGKVMPGGHGWDAAQRIRMPEGRPPSPSGDTEELERAIVNLGGVTKAAEFFGTSKSYLSQIRHGKRPISNRISGLLRMRTVKQNPY